jgi:DNA polymerase
MNQTAVKSRLRLWLRSEHALGARAVPKPKAPVNAASSPVEEIKHSQSIPIPENVKSELRPNLVIPLVPAGPALSTAEKLAQLSAMNVHEVSVCRSCRLCEGRTKTVFGEGDPDAKIMFIGEAPGETEDHTGRPFVGRAGDLLNRMIAGMGLKREEVFIANIIKCRPPANRVPAPDEVAACTPYLVRQIDLIRPRVIVTLGLPAAKYMLDTNTSMGKLRGVWHEWRGVRLMPTYHPAYLLRAYTDENRAAVWSDLKKVMAELGLKAK